MKSKTLQDGRGGVSMVYKTVQFKVPSKSTPSSTFSFPNGFSGGMNISISPDQLLENQSPDMVNCSYDGGGVPSKRFGLTKVTSTSWGLTPIRGIHEFYKIGSSEPIFLIAHGGKLYSYNETTDTKTDLCTGSVLSFNDGPVVFTDMGDKCFFLTGKEYLYYDGTNPVNTVQSIAWVPTTVLGKKADGTGGTPNEKFNHLSQKWKESFSPNGTATEFQLNKINSVTLTVSGWKAWSYGTELAEGTGFTVDRTTWKVTFSSPPLQGTDSLQIQLEATNLMDSTVITKCTQIIEFGGKNDSVVFMTGNPAFPNTARYSWIYDPTYWPEDYDFNVGGDSRAISGWGRMNEYLISYKEPGDQTLQWYSEITIGTLGDIAFNTYALNDEFGCLSPNTVKPAQNGLLALSDQGLVWTWPSLVKGQANCKIISRNINGRNGIASGLLDNTLSDLKKAHAEVYGNKYYLHVKDTVWVLDLDYSDLGQGIFCWYPYKGLYANAGGFLRRSGRLYMQDKGIGLLYKEQRPGDNTEYADDNLAIDAWWTSPLMFLGGREWIKKFERINLTFKASHGTEHILYLISDSGTEEIPIHQVSGFFDARYFHAAYFHAGAIAPDFPSSQSEKIGVKAEYMQFKIRNNMLNRAMVMLAAMITFSNRKIVK